MSKESLRRQERRKRAAIEDRFIEQKGTGSSALEKHYSAAYVIWLEQNIVDLESRLDRLGLLQGEGRSKS